MSTANVASANPSQKSEELQGHSKSATPEKGFVERRRRKRAKISAQLHLSAVNAPEPFEEVCMTMDVSRDGLLFTASRTGYWKGQNLDIIFPYSDAAADMTPTQRAEIVRVTDLPGGKFGVAVQFTSARLEAKQEKKGASSAAGSSVVPAPAPQENQQTVILAVEPDARSADAIRHLLQQDGYTVVIVKTGKEALDVLRSTIPAAFIAEVEAQDMSGHDLCLIVKRNERLAQVPVILLTRSGQPADYSASHQMGAVVCMTKPFQPERLLHVVRLVAPPPQHKTTYGASRGMSSTIERSL